jgi:hypothetical protein
MQGTLHETEDGRHALSFEAPRSRARSTPGLSADKRALTRAA